MRNTQGAVLRRFAESSGVVKHLGGTFFPFDRWCSKSAVFVVVWHNNDRESKHNVRCGCGYICDVELCARALQLMHASANASYVLVVTVMEGEK